MGASAISRSATALTWFPPVDLATLVDAADLQQRFDAKYVIDLDRLPDLWVGIGGNFRVLEVHGRRSTDYSSVYFDTPQLRTYHDHLKGRRRRFKVRTRHYGDPAATVLELKCKTGRGQTAKHRWPHAGEPPDALGAHAEQLIGRALEERYGFGLPGRLEPVATTRFERVTMVDLEAGERITIDFDLAFAANERNVRLGADHVVVETKAPKRRGVATGAMVALGLRPQRMSKYCVGIAASHESIRGNPWIPVLRQLRAAGPLAPA